MGESPHPQRRPICERGPRENQPDTPTDWGTGVVNDGLQPLVAGNGNTMSIFFWEGRGEGMVHKQTRDKQGKHCQCHTASSTQTCIPLVMHHLIRWWRHPIRTSTGPHAQQGCSESSRCSTGQHRPPPEPPPLLHSPTHELRFIPGPGTCQQPNEPTCLI